MTETCHLHWFVERDIDLLLAEELRVNPQFSGWLMGQLAPGLALAHPAAETLVSAFDNGSETDVLASFRTASGGLHRLWIENKIDAGLMPSQLERYLARARDDVARGGSEGFTVLLFAPRAYGAPLPAGVQRLAFETAAQALRRLGNDPRAAYRAELLERAAGRAAGRGAPITQAAPHVAAWWDAIYAMLEREFPGVFEAPRTRYPRELFFAPRSPGMAPYLRVDFKARKGEVDLAFKRVPFEVLAATLHAIGDHPGRPIANRESSALRIDGLEPFGFDMAAVDTHARAAFAAARDLLAHAARHRATYDTMVRRSAMAA